jgi:hypothetical protein
MSDGFEHGIPLRPSRATRDGSEALHSTERNWLLQALPQREHSLILPHLEPADVASLEVLAEAEQPLAHVHFPETAVISMVRRLRDGSLIETAMVGREGMTGLSVLIDDNWSSGRLEGQVPGTSKRVAYHVLQRALPGLPTLSSLIQCFLQSLLDQKGQGLACNILHSVRQRCARWLLTTRDQVGSDDFALSSEALSRMLAVPRSAALESLRALEQRALIAYDGDHVTIADRPRLLELSCECYEVMRSHAARLLGRDPADIAS